MAQKIEISPENILLRLAKLESDIKSIKLRLEDENLKEEITTWEETSAIDASNFLEKYNL